MPNIWLVKITVAIGIRIETLCGPVWRRDKCLRGFLAKKIRNSKIVKIYEFFDLFWLASKKCTFFRMPIFQNIFFLILWKFFHAYVENEVLQFQQFSLITYKWVYSKNIFSSCNTYGNIGYVDHPKIRKVKYCVENHRKVKYVFREVIKYSII